MDCVIESAWELESVGIAAPNKSLLNNSLLGHFFKLTSGLKCLWFSLIIQFKIQDQNKLEHL